MYTMSRTMFLPLVFVLLFGCSQCFIFPFNNRKLTDAVDSKLAILERLADRIERRVNSLTRVTDDTTAKNFITKVLETLVKIFGMNNIYKTAHKGVKSKSYCIGCKIVLTLIRAKFSKELLAKTFSGVCIALNVQSDEVCQGIINSFKNDLDYIRTHSTLSTVEMCDILLGLQCFNTNSNKTLWEIPLPEKIHRRSRSGRRHYNTNSFIQITDNHLDFNYEAGSNAVCDKPICCEKGTKPDSEKTAAGEWADYRKCDIKTEVFDSAIADANTRQNVDFWLLTGDVAPHTVWKITRQDVYDYLYTSTKVFHRNNVRRVFPVLGNHEGIPIGAFPPPGIGGDLDVSWIYNYAADQWKGWLSQEALETFRRAGNYKEIISPGVILLVVNSNYCARLNIWSLYDPVDAGDQLKWLAAELFNAENENQRAHIAMHIPPDNRECFQAWTHNYVRIIERFKNTIIGQYYGHTHYDEIRLIYSLTNESYPVGVQYISPAVTTYSGTNPAYRIYHTDSGFLTDIDTYWMNLTEANSGRQDWKLEYSTKASAKLINLSEHSWHHHLNAIETQEDTRKEFFKYYYVSTDFEQINCDNDCKAEKIEDQRIRHPIKNPAKGFHI